MTKSKSKPADAPRKPNTAFQVARAEGDSIDLATAKAFLRPDFRHGMAVSDIQRGFIGTLDFSPSGLDYTDAVTDIADKAAKGDMAFVSRMLAAQAITLDNVFAEMTRRMAINMGEYLGATETYARIALKAQGNSRATLEALTKLHQPREQTVRHVHVNEGGQAVIADQFHHHTGGQENGQSTDQPHATGTGATGEVSALPSPDPLRNGVPIPCRERKRPVPDARRQG